MSDQDNGQVSTLQRPTTDDPEAWRVYWNAQGWPWRTEPEIDAERQKYLDERRKITPDIVKGIYPFKDVEPKLTRADVEWLLITHENGRGPVDWNDKKQRDREGLDLRGAILSQIDLHRLPLACLRGGLFLEWTPATIAPIHYARSYLERANLTEAHLEGANLRGAHLERANLSWAHLEDALLHGTHLEGAILVEAHLEGADLNIARLQRANLYNAYVEGADLRGAHLEGTILQKMVLVDEKHIGPRLADVEWGEDNLSVLKWSQVEMLRDEYQARQRKLNGKIKDWAVLLEEHEEAVRANRQLAVALQAQGLSEDAARFGYRAQKLQRVVLRMQKKFGQYLFSGFLDLLAGYGYRPGRSVLWYLAVIFGFALAYFAIGHLPFFPDAFVFSLTSFHGRGFFPGLGTENSLHNPLVVTAAFEAVIGLLIEISFIATFTQRFFGR